MDNSTYISHNSFFSVTVVMAAENDSRVVCPQTKEIFKFEEAEKVFVM